MIQGPILVTGSAGFIGQALCQDLRSRGVPIREFDLNGPFSQDLHYMKTVEDAVVGCRGIVHLAALTRVAVCEENKFACWQTNVHGTQNLILAARDQADMPWMVFASSREIYGAVGSPQFPITEAAGYGPINTYGLSKMVGEQAVKLGGFPSAILRFANVYGGEFDLSGRVIPTLLRRAREGLPLFIDNPDHVLDFVHIDDVVRGIVLAMQYLSDGGRLSPTHLVSGTSTSLSQLATMIRELVWSDSPIQITRPQPYDVQKFYANPTQAKQLLGWATTIPLRQGLTSMLP